MASSVEPISKPRGWPDVITVFLRSLTEHWGGQLIAVIVSGYDGDGAAALCGIKEVGGITIAQKLDTAEQPDMPQSAIASGCIDLILSPEDISREIVRIAQRSGAMGAKELPSGGLRRLAIGIAFSARRSCTDRGEPHDRAADYRESKCRVTSWPCRPRVAGQGSSLSSFRSRLYLDNRSDVRTDPTLIWPAPDATARSARKSSSVSPDRAEITAR